LKEHANGRRAASLGGSLSVYDSADRLQDVAMRRETHSPKTDATEEQAERPDSQESIPPLLA